MADPFSPIDADPYRWPFDGQWSADDTALLALGFQNAAIEALKVQAEVAIAARLVSAASACGMLVVASRKGASASSLTPGGQLSADLDLPAAVPVVDHAGDNAFYNTALEQLLRSRGIRNLLICGLPTEGLVHASQRNANDMGFECLAISDACKGTTEERHVGQLRITTFGNGLFGAVAASDAVLQSISAR